MTIFMLPRFLHYAYHFSVDSEIKKERKCVKQFRTYFFCHYYPGETEKMSTLLSAAVSFIQSVPYIFEQAHKKLS